jgi:6-pyruvoyltetrahydropterin/6-carboxytetrahydropterin synthase
MSRPVARLARRKPFSCLHRYAVEKWSDDQNREVFGACFLPEGHGHNYQLEAYFEGPIDATTGMILNLIDVDQLLGRLVAPLEGRRLDVDVAAFRGVVPTTENIALYLFAELEPQVKGLGVRLAKLRLYEYEDLWVDVWP